MKKLYANIVPSYLDSACLAYHLGFWREALNLPSSRTIVAVGYGSAPPVIDFVHMLTRGTLLNRAQSVKVRLYLPINKPLTYSDVVFTILRVSLQL